MTENSKARKKDPGSEKRTSGIAREKRHRREKAKKKKKQKQEKEKARKGKRAD